MPDENDTNSKRQYKELWPDHDIGYLIKSTERYIVYIDNEGDIDWATSDPYDSVERESSAFDLKKRNAFENDAALLEATPSAGLSPQTCRQFKRLVGEALVCSLEFDYTSARSMLAEAQSFIRARIEEVSRYWYLLASITGWLPFAVVGVIGWLIRFQLRAFIGIDAFWLLFAMIGGAFGALLSVITRAGRLKFDSSAGRPLHWLEGCSRIAAGAISALVVALAVRSGIILSPLLRNHELYPAMMLAALVAGAGERLAPSKAMTSLAVARCERSTSLTPI
jgi:hypothetical protein